VAFASKSFPCVAAYKVVAARGLAVERETHEHVLALHRPALDPAW
jgi:hypothetical protein